MPIDYSKWDNLDCSSSDDEKDNKKAGNPNPLGLPTGVNPDNIEDVFGGMDPEELKQKMNAQLDTEEFKAQMELAKKSTEKLENVPPLAEEEARKTYWLETMTNSQRFVTILHMWNVLGTEERKGILKMLVEKLPEHMSKKLKTTTDDASDLPSELTYPEPWTAELKAMETSEEKLKIMEYLWDLLGESEKNHLAAVLSQ